MTYDSEYHVLMSFKGKTAWSVPVNFSHWCNCQDHHPHSWNHAAPCGFKKIKWSVWTSNWPTNWYHLYQGLDPNSAGESSFPHWSDHTLRIDTDIFTIFRPPSPPSIIWNWLTTIYHHRITINLIVIDHSKLHPAWVARQQIEESGAAYRAEDKAPSWDGQKTIRLLECFDDLGMVGYLAYHGLPQWDNSWRVSGDFSKNWWLYRQVIFGDNHPMDPQFCIVLPRPPLCEPMKCLAGLTVEQWFHCFLYLSMSLQKPSKTDQKPSKTIKNRHFYPFLTFCWNHWNHHRYPAGTSSLEFNKPWNPLLVQAPMFAR